MREKVLKEEFSIVEDHTGLLEQNLSNIDWDIICFWVQPGWWLETVDLFPSKMVKLSSHI